MKKSKLFLGLSALFFLSPMQVDAASVYVNNTIITSDVQPIIKDGRTMVPLNVIATELGHNVEWDAMTKTVLVDSSKNSLSLVDSNSTDVKVIVSGKLMSFDVNPLIINGRTMVPLNAIATSLNHKVEWDANTKSVLVNSDTLLVNPEKESDTNIKTNSKVKIDEKKIIEAAKKDIISELNRGKNMYLVDGENLDGEQALNYVGSADAKILGYYEDLPLIEKGAYAFVDIKGAINTDCGILHLVNVDTLSVYEAAELYSYYGFDTYTHWLGIMNKEKYISIYFSKPPFKEEENVELGLGIDEYKDIVKIYNTSNMEIIDVVKDSDSYEKWHDFYKKAILSRQSNF